VNYPFNGKTGTASVFEVMYGGSEWAEGFCFMTSIGAGDFLSGAMSVPLSSLKNKDPWPNKHCRFKK